MSERDIPSLLQDILEAIGNIKDFTRGMTFDMYLGDLKTKHAVERNFQLLEKQLQESTSLSGINIHPWTGGK
jgi:uncharacterized protein with HEPN domain